MYLNFYNLKKKPFQITPDPEFLFLSPTHREALASIVYGVEQRKGFIMITGEVGVGKTSVVRYYLEHFDKGNLEIIYIFNHNLSLGGLLKTIFRKMGFVPASEDASEMVNELHLILIEKYKQGRNMALIFDEAQNMPIGVLENLRMLSNLEASNEKLVQIVLVGQPEFEDMLNREELRQLKQRIAVKTAILPLTREESMAYVQNRLNKASLNGSKVFRNGALKKIIAESRGIPRLVNVLCDNALITGFGYQAKLITSRVVKEVIGDFRTKRGRPSFSALEVASIVVITALFIAGAFALYLNGRAVLSQLEAVPKFFFREKGVSGGAELSGRSVSGRIVIPQAGSAPVVGKETAGDGRESFPVIKTVREGDTLAGLVLDVYGRQDKELIQFVMQKNPGISSSSIRVGDKLIFPAHAFSREDR